MATSVYKAELSKIKFPGSFNVFVCLFFFLQKAVKMLIDNVDKVPVRVP